MVISLNIEYMRKLIRTSVKDRIISFAFFALMFFFLGNIDIYASENVITGCMKYDIDSKLENKSGIESVYDFESIIADNISKELIQLDSVTTVAFDENIYLTNEAAVTQIMKDGVKQHKSNITVYIRSKDSQYFDLFDRMWEAAFTETDDPVEGDYLYWQMTNMTSSVVGRTKQIGSIKYYYYTFTIAINYYTTVEQENVLTTAIENVNNSFNFDETTTDYDKILTIYNYICHNVKYDYSSNDIKFSAYSALIDEKAVCQGYSSLFYRFAKMNGISNRIIAGHGTSQSVYHGWNIVKIGELYYNLDTTWDAVNYINSKPYTYFLVGDVFSEHTRNDEYNTAQFYASYPMAANDYTIGQNQVASSATIDAEFVKQKASIKKVTRKKITLNKVTNATGYVILYSAKKNFKTRTKVTTTKNTYKLKKLKKRVKYYFKVRAYRDSSIGKKYTQWSKMKIVK